MKRNEKERKRKRKEKGKGREKKGKEKGIRPEEEDHKVCGEENHGRIGVDEDINGIVDLNLSKGH